MFSFKIWKKSIEKEKAVTLKQTEFQLQNRLEVAKCPQRKEM